MIILIIAGPEIIFVKQLSEYLVHIMLGLFGLGFIFLFTDYSKLMLVSFAACAVLCVFLKNESNGELVYPKDNYSGKVIVSHINLSNVVQGNEMLRLLNEGNIDILSFQEMTPEWKDYLKNSLKNNFPYYYEAVRIDPYGKAIFSRYPIKVLDTLSRAYAFDIACEVNIKDDHYLIVSTYLIPSLNNTSLTLAKSQMKNISTFVNENKSKVIVLGEFNMVYWSEEIRKFREASLLNNARKDVIPASLKIPYDHIFYSNDLQCMSVRDLMINRTERIGLLSTFQKNLDLNDKATKTN